MRIALVHTFALTLLLTAGVGAHWNRVFRQPPHSPPPAEGLKTDDDYAVEDLVRNIFVKGVCDNISNIEAIGDEAGIGFFENGQDVIGLDRGIILSTGPVQNAEGPNDVTDDSGDFSDASGDGDLGLLATGPVRDAVGIEFDFVPLDSFVTFRYVFASEEYCEFVGSIYNDVFGFFISGPGIEGNFGQGAENVALIPGTDDYVAINDVNYLNNSEYFIRNELPADAEQCNLQPVNWPNQALIQYDGFTRKLTASLRLIPCETYHIRLLVGDVGDAFYDSAVFLEAGSFNIGGAVSVTTIPGGATEGCGDGGFRFTRSDQEALDNPLTVGYAISANSTATEGEDFEPLPGQITIPAGSPSVDLLLNTINDQVAELPEKLVLVLDIPCACYADSATTIIRDGPPLLVALPDAAFCGVNPTELTPEVTGGRPGYTYQWSTGATGPAVWVAPVAPHAYSVTVSDACGNVAADTGWVHIKDPPEAELTGFAEVCEGDTAWLPVTFSGAPPWMLEYAVDGQIQPAITGITDSSFLLPATLGGSYTIERFRDADCWGDGYSNAQVALLQLDIQAAVDSTSCADTADGGIRIEITEGAPPYTFDWSAGLAPEAEIDNLPPGEYTLHLTDGRGCEKEQTFAVFAPTPLEEVLFDCEDLAGSALHLTARGGTPPYYYSTDGEQFYDEQLFDQLIPGESYDLIIQDANECRYEQPFTMPALYQHMAELPAELEFNLGETGTIQPVLNIPPTLLASIRWIPGDGLSCSDCLEPALTALQEQVYTVRFIDRFGCTDEASVRIRINPRVDVFIPTAFSPDGDQINDRLTVFANPVQVQRVLSFQVFDRWGGRIFAAENFRPNDENAGWDGRFKGLPLDPGVYVYSARLLLIDGSEEVVRGDVLLAR